MNEVDFPRVEVSVALLSDEQQRVFFHWNQNWGAFTLPMSKRRRGGGIAEAPEKAARRAAAEAMGVPCRVEEHLSQIPDWLVSERDFQTKRYRYDIYRVAVHPEFADALHIRQPHIWLSAEQAFSGDYQPITVSSLDILSQLAAKGIIPKTTVRFTSVLVAKRRMHDQPSFLLRYDRDWGFALPGKHRELDQEPLEIARQIAQEDLHLQPGAEVILCPAHLPVFTTFDVSDRTGEKTYYTHSLFRADLQAKPSSDRPLVWVQEGDIQRGQVPPQHAAPGGDTRISRTVHRPLSALDEIDWIDAG